MGFPIVEIRMPEYEGMAAAKFERWRVPKNDYVPRDVPIAELSVGGNFLSLVCNMPVVIEDTKAQPGDSIVAGQLVALALAEGHEIPYGRPYARIEVSR